MANSYALDLYGEVEDLLKLDSSTQKLHSIYLKKLNKIKFNSLLDIGSGNGNFLLKVKKRYKNIDIMGIEKSPYMRKISLKKGVSVYSSLDEIDREFDIAVAIFDMVNYLSFKELKEFFEKLYLKL
ncbi:MAG: class I SAM-dependent methyltransferase, partial [Epsilonproteobacteria bacterium]|nr:class I SAM-dependent methyltransferase [Campylobacterota bacterium]